MALDGFRTYGVKQVPKSTKDGGGMTWLEFGKRIQKHRINIRVQVDTHVIHHYDENNRSFDKYHIYLTSSLFYHSLCTTFNSYFLKMNRIFFDEIDSISNTPDSVLKTIKAIAEVENKIENKIEKEIENL